MGEFDTAAPEPENKGGAQFAEDYDDLHKTFEKYYVDDSDKKTLDSAIADIEHSYNENNDEMGSAHVAQTSPVEEEPDATAENSAQVPEPETQSQTQATEAPTNVPDNVATDDEPNEEAPVVEELPTPEPEETPVENIPDEKLPLPENRSEQSGGKTLFGDGFMAEELNGVIRIFDTNGIRIALTDNIAPTFTPGVEKTLCDFFVDGTRLTAVYTASGSYPADASVDGMLDTLYGPREGSRNSVEVCIYNIFGGMAVLDTNFRQDGCLVDMNMQNASLYLVTAYNDYRTAPIIGVEDLQSYVPSYTVNGTKVYIEPTSIMIPEYLATTDYTVISGITPGGGVSVQAVLGYEGRVILKPGAVYLFGYDSSLGNDVTSAKVFSLANGQVVYSGTRDILGVALGGAGISQFGDYIAVTSVMKTADGCDTVLDVYNGLMETVSRVTFSGAALTSVERIGDVLRFKGAKDVYCIDLSDPTNPSRVDEPKNEEDPAEGLVEAAGGYITLTKNSSGEIVLSKLSKDRSGSLRLDFKTTVCSESGARSKALDDNGIMMVSGNTVGVPYGYFDGLDYCFRYALYNITPSGFEPAADMEIHETDAAFEFGKAVMGGDSMYIFSEGRIYRAAVQDGIAVTGTANIIESAYSGH